MIAKGAEERGPRAEAHGVDEEREPQIADAAGQLPSVTVAEIAQQHRRKEHAASAERQTPHLQRAERHAEGDDQHEQQQRLLLQQHGDAIEKAGGLWRGCWRLAVGRAQASCREHADSESG